jgi:small subunit ribosomal protein S17
METATKGRKASKIGTVTSSAMEKTVVVKVDSLVMHPLYHRFVKRSKKFMAHDEANQCGVGDTVQIVECRPLSRRKRWRVTRVIEKAR